MSPPLYFQLGSGIPISYPLSDTHTPEPQSLAWLRSCSGEGTVPDSYGDREGGSKGRPGTWGELTELEILDRVGLTWLRGFSISSIAWGRDEQMSNRKADTFGPAPGTQLLPSHTASLLYLVQSHSALGHLFGAGGEDVTQESCVQLKWKWHLSPPPCPTDPWPPLRHPSIQPGWIHKVGTLSVVTYGRNGAGKTEAVSYWSPRRLPTLPSVSGQETCR